MAWSGIISVSLVVLANLSVYCLHCNNIFCVHIETLICKEISLDLHKFTLCDVYY